MSAGCAECGTEWSRVADLVDEFNDEAAAVARSLALHGTGMRRATGGCEVTFCPRCLSSLGLVVRDDETGGDG